ncbi:PP31 [Alphabaculovirus myunipunctae]|uniref:PP31 n=1 Tax=Mythimna unipuncta nucleopolyhedrovirus TaxID=447897 RepID=A0A2K9VSI1_9ABAC|nr:PP31 [Mythimna unipuncta nucleopolyhedrovirus]AUV65396.1 PP31 [Mythimna unipuncta nucleopolyhedrovirus]
MASATTTTTTTTSTAAATPVDQIKGDNVIYNKTQMDQVATVMHVLEKKKVKYNVIPMPVYGDDGGLQVSYAIMINVDKKGVKKNKKMISNNKYILFNSWYTKNREESWPNSHTMWNLMKQQSAAKPFIEIFDVMEKLGKTVEVKSQQDEATTTEAAAIDDIKKGNELRTKLYNEFYRITTQTFSTNSAPTSSFIYELRLKKSYNGVDRLSSNMLQHGVESLKKILYSVVNKDAKQRIKSAPAPAVCVDENRLRKRKQATPKAVPPPKKSKKETRNNNAFIMQNDSMDDSQLSFS